MIAIISAMSMLIGAFGALMQNSVKRILAYSSISNVGFALIGIAAGEEKSARHRVSGLHGDLRGRHTRHLRRRPRAAPRAASRWTKCRTSTASASSSPASRSA